MHPAVSDFLFSEYQGKHGNNKRNQCCDESRPDLLGNPWFLFSPVSREENSPGNKM